MTRDAPVSWALVQNTARYYARHRRPIAGARALFLTIMFRNGKELCQICGRSYSGTTWHCRQSLWLRVVGSTHGTWCPRCLSRRAEKCGIRVLFVAEPWIVNGVQDAALVADVWDGYVE